MIAHVRTVVLALGAAGALGAGGLAGAASAPATATPATAATAKVVVSPRPGQVVTRHRVTIVVRAGNEHRDLRVTLNGRQLGEDFPMGKGGVRRLQVSASHGLRHGRNVLTVRARRGIVTRSASVRFTVRRTAPLVGAGRDRTVTVGQPLQLGGRLDRAPGGRKARRVSWKVIDAPRGSRGRRLTTRATGRKKGTGSARSATARAPTARAAAAPAVVTPTSALRPALTPDKVGTYTVQMKEGVGPTAQVDTVTVQAIPADPLVPFDTQVPAASSSTGAPQPGVRVNGTTYRMPYLGFENGQGAYDSSGDGVGQFHAEWQLVAVDRSTLELLYNRTYGWCRVNAAGGGTEWAYCRSPDNPAPGQSYQPMVVDPGVEIARDVPAGSAGGLVVARTSGASTPAGGPATYAGILRDFGYGQDPPSGPTPITQPTAVVGVPGMQPGEAVVSARPDGELPGWLTHDQNYHYHYLSNVRPVFDTRSAATCAAADCTVSQTFAGQTVSATVPKGQSGYFVSGWDPVTLQATGSRFVAMQGAPDRNAEAEQMLGLLQTLDAKQSIVAITTLRTPGSSGRLVGGTQATWDAITAEVAALGGTKNGFLTTASSALDDYTMVGWGGAGEDNGREAGGGSTSARLRGAFAPDRTSHLRPADVSSLGPATERLDQLILRPTATDWKYPDASTGKGAAIQCIGAALQEGVDIRGQYASLTTAAAANTLRDQVDDLAIGELAPVPGTTLACAPTPGDYAAAQAQLKQELDWVAKVRTYLSDLSVPSTAQGGAVWGQALTLGNELEQQLTDDASQAEATADALDFVAALLDLLVPGIDTVITDADKITNAVSASASTFILASQGMTEDADGGPDVDPNVAATDLAAHMQIKAEQAAAAFVPLGDVIVSDPDKLAEVGGSANCAIGVPGGCKPGMEEYAAPPADVADLTNVSVRAMGRTIYAKLVASIYPTWDTGITDIPADPYGNFSCLGVLSPFDRVSAASYAAGLDTVDVIPNEVPPMYRVFLMIRSAETWDWPAPVITDRMFGPVGATWDQGGLGMDPLKTIRDASQRFVPGSYSCSF